MRNVSAGLCSLKDVTAGETAPYPALRVSARRRVCRPNSRLFYNWSELVESPRNFRGSPMKVCNCTLGKTAVQVALIQQHASGSVFFLPPLDGEAKLPPPKFDGVLFDESTPL